MTPFDAYPHAGRALLGRVKGANCRREYGLQFMKQTGQTACAYCGLDFAAAYENWLQMALDHVVPGSVGACLGIPAEWMDDSANKVLACAACNGFKNRYKAPADATCPATLDAFFDLRDRIFAERKTLVAARHEDERAFYAQRLWETSLAPNR
jgi:hypothetical protein